MELFVYLFVFLLGRERKVEIRWRYLYLPVNLGDTLRRSSCGCLLACTLASQFQFQFQSQFHVQWCAIRGFKFFDLSVSLSKMRKGKIDEARFKLKYICALESSSNAHDSNPASIESRSRFFSHAYPFPRRYKVLKILRSIDSV